MHNKLLCFILLFGLTACNSSTPSDQKAPEAATEEPVAAEEGHIGPPGEGEVIAEPDPTDKPESGVVMSITSDPAIDQAKLHNEVLRSQDEALSKLSELNKVKRSLVEIMRTDQQNPLNDATKDNVSSLMAKVDSATTAIFDWRKSFKNPASSVSHKEAMDYLQAEKVKLKRIQAQIVKATEEGRAFTEPFGQ
ncbi:MAG: hypothetical protein AAGG75_10120 [Bacteroidota bacterium]